MDAKVIDIFAERDKRKAAAEPVKGAYLFSLDLYAPAEGDMPDGAVICPDGSPSADDFRYFAVMLNRMARMIHDHAESLSPSEDGMILAEATVFSNSRVRAFFSNSIETGAQREWLAERFDDAKGMI